MEVDDNKTPITKLSGMIASETCAYASEYEHILSVFTLVSITSRHITSIIVIIFNYTSEGVLVTSIMI